MSRRERLIRFALLALSIAAIALPVLTVFRFPTPFADVQLYASIALARYTYGVGIPTITWNSPAAVDHIPFYGPVFFDLAALLMRFFGGNLLSLRLLSLAGTGLYVVGTALLAGQFTRSRDRVLLATTLVLLTPEVNYGATGGAMHMLAVGFELLAMAIFVRQFDRRRAGIKYGVSAGICLVLAALTTPRSYFFVVAFVAAGILPSIFGTARAAIRYRLSATILVLTAGMSGWAVVSHGSVTSWVRYMTFIFTHEDTDVAVLGTAVRDFDFHWSGLISPAVAVGLGLLAAWSLGQRALTSMTGREAGQAASRNGALSFLIACAWIDFIASVVCLNYTFSIQEYLVLPLLSVVVAFPWNTFIVRRRLTAQLLGAFLCAELVVLGYRYVRLAATWSAHDPGPLNAFVERFVPRGSVVVGPEQPYLFPVERNGSRYRTVSPRSWADWARWVPLIEPGATRVARTFPQLPPVDRFIIWHADEELPDGYECAAHSVVAQYRAPEVAPGWPEWMRRVAATYEGYPSTTLYRLPEGCPSGYDPTKRPAR